MNTLYELRKERAEQQILYINSKYSYVIQGQASLDQQNIKDGKNFIKAINEHTMIQYDVPPAFER